jgi:TatD DNase family protein
MFDAHIHLNQYKEIDQRIEQWKNAGITGVVAVSTDLQSSYDTLYLKQKYPNFIFAAIGFHPEQPLPPAQDVAEWHRLLHDERHLISAVGEVGLPYYSLHQYENASLESYIEFLDCMVSISKAEDLPIVLHAVHSHAPIAYELLIKHQAKKAHFHWLKAEPSVIQQIVQSGYYISVTPEVCYRNRDHVLVRQLPLNQLLIETDGPWPFSGPFQNKPTSPIFLKDVTEKVRELKEIPYETVVQQVNLNTLSLYKG